MTGENEPRPDQHAFRSDRPWFKYAAIGAICITGAAFTANHVYDSLAHSGEGGSYAPTGSVEPAIDSRTTIVTWNAENRLGSLIPQIRSINSRFHPDAFLFQEGSVKGANRLHAAFPDMYVKYRVTDGKYNFDNGGQALVAMSPQPIEDVSDRVFAAPSLIQTSVRVIKGLQKDLVVSAFAASPQLDNATKAPQENRLAMAFTIKAYIHGKLQNIRVVTSHVTPTEEFQGEQLDQNVHFLRENDQSGRPTIFCADANEDPPVYIPKIAEAGFITPITGPTSHDNRTIDYCSYKPGEDMLGLGQAEVLDYPGSDHKALAITFNND